MHLNVVDGECSITIIGVSIGIGIDADVSIDIVAIVECLLGRCNGSRCLVLEFLIRYPNHRQ